MRVRKQIGPANDYPFGGGQNDFLVDSPEAVGQLIETRLRMSVGDYFLNARDGTPYLTQVLGYNTAGTRDFAIQDRILSTQGVDEITQYSSSNDTLTRALSMTATVDTAYGSDAGSTVTIAETL